MNIAETKASFKHLFAAQVTPFLWGHAGIGKSSIVKQYAVEMGYKFFPFYLGTQSDLGDILGLAEFVTNDDGSKSTDFATPKWLKDVIDYCETNPDSGAVIFLDEFNRARRDILSGMFSLALDKTFHTLRLPDNCHLVAAGNPPTEEYYVTDVNETALMARFVHIKLEPTVQEWVTYAKAISMEPSLIGFIQEQPELLADTKSTFDLPVKVDNRSWHRVDRLFQVGTPKDLMEKLMVGIIGAERLVAYKAYLDNAAKPLTATQVFAGEGQDLLAEWSKATDIKASLISVTCDNVYLRFEEDTKKGLKAYPTEVQDNFMNFLSAIPIENAYSLMRRLLRSGEPATGDSLFLNFTKNPAYINRLLAITKTAKPKPSSAA